MRKVTIHQTTQSGRIINDVGDGQEITITTVNLGRGRHVSRTVPSIPEDDIDDDDEDFDGDEEDIINPIGKNAKVFINGKQVR